jgi:hypothetical protein
MDEPASASRIQMFRLQTSGLQLALIRPAIRPGL